MVNQILKNWSWLILGSCKQFCLSLSLMIVMDLYNSSWTSTKNLPFPLVTDDFNFCLTDKIVSEHESSLPSTAYKVCKAQEK